MNDITFVLTSCGRWDLLKDTIDSFLDCNVYPINDFIITEDSGEFDIYNEIKKHYGHLFQYIIFNETGQRQGIAIIDKAYQIVKTPFIFHCEDDWHFHNEGFDDFIANSIEILKEDSEILQVHIRDKDTIKGQKVEDIIHITKKGVEYSYLTRWGEWNGFSLNPGVRRLSNYQLIAPYSQFIQPATRTHGSRVITEKTIAEVYTNKGYKGVHIGDYCYHTGDNRRA